MTRCKTQRVYVCLLILGAVIAALPAFGQDGDRGFIGLEAGQTSDKFGGLAPVKGPMGGVEGEWIVIKGTEKNATPNIILGGEIRFPSDTSQHASEFAAYLGPHFRAGSHWTIGFNAQVRKLYVPPGQLQGATFNRDKMLIFEIPFVLEYRFGALRHAFVQLQASPEFSGRLNSTVSQPSPLPKPSFDLGYSGRVSAGYIFGKWYAKATYQSRYLKFQQGLGNPLDLYTWHADQITGGVGIVF
jgi:hypothetical protein